MFDVVVRIVDYGNIFELECRVNGWLVFCVFWWLDGFEI